MAAIPIELKFGLDTSGASAGINQVLSEWSSMTREMKNEWNKALGGSDVQTKVQVVYEVDDNGLVKANTYLKDQYDVLDKLKKEYDKLNKVEKDSVSSLRQQLNTARQNRDAIARTVVESQALESSTGKIVQVTKRVNDEWRQANLEVQALKRILGEAGGSNFFERLQSAFKDTGLSQFASGIQGIVGTFQSIAIVVQQVSAAFNTLVGSAKQIESLNLTFKSIGQGVEGGALAFQKASQISQDLGVNLKTTLTGFQQLTPVILANGGTLDDVSGIVEALSTRFVAFGKSADEAKRIMNAVVQAFGKGKLQSEELNQQIAEADPAFRTDLANAIGVSVAQLGQMVEKGKVTSQMLLDVLPNLGKADQLFKLVGMSATQAALALGNKVAPTLEQVQNKINALNALTLVALAEAFRPVIGAIFVVQAALADFFNQLANSGALSGIAAVIGSIAQGFAVLTIGVLKVAEVVIALLSPLGSVVQAILSFEAAGVKLSTILGTIVALGIVGWFGSIAGSALKASADVAAFASQMLGKITAIGNAQRAQKAAEAAAEAAAAGAKTASAAATTAETGATIANTTATAANTVANQANAASEGVGVTAKAASAAAINTETAALSTNTTAQVAANAAKGAGATQLTMFKDAATGVIGEQLELALGATKVKDGVDAAGAAAGKSKGLFAGLRGAISGLAGNFPVLNKGVGEVAKSLGGALVTGLRSAAVAMKAFIATAAPLLLVAAAAGAVALAINNGRKAFEEGGKVTEQYSNATNNLDAAIKKANASANSSSGAVEKVGTSWDGAAKRVGGFAAATDVLSRFFTKNSIELASYNNELIASGQGFDKFYNKLQQGYGAFEQSTRGIQGNKEALAQAKQLYDAQTAAINGQINALRAKNEADSKIRAGGKEEQDALNANIAQRKQQLVVLEAEKNKITKLAQARGVETKSVEQNTEALKANYASLKLRSDQINLINTAKIDELKERWDAEKAAIEQAKQASDRKFQDEKMRIDEVKSAEQSRHNAVKRNLDSEKNAVTERYDKEINALKKLDEAIKAQTQAKLDALKAETPAEAELAKLRVDELRVQAARARTYEERLQAQAQLERIEADKKAEEIKKKADAEEKVRQQEIKRLEEEKEAKLKEIRDKERAEDVAHQKKMEEFAKQDLELRKKEMQERRKFEDEERKAREKYGPQIKALEKEIKDAKYETEKAQLAVNKAEGISKGLIADNSKTQEIFTGKVNDSKIAMDKLNISATNLSRTLANMKPPPPISGQRFAGGPVGAGQSYTINELGKEAFLSSSGKLSWINKPAWSKWQAPSSGTVIPAHIAAGLDIPSGGVNINRSTVRNVSNSVVGRSIDYRAMSKALQGGNSVGVINNSVTISSNTPVKSASDMLVELTKLRRNRYY